MWNTRLGYKGSQRVLMLHASHDPRWVKISGHSEQLGPCGSTTHFVNNRHSRVKTRGASCIGGFGQTDGQRKFELGIPKSRVRLILDACLILETRRYITFYVQKHTAHLVALFLFPLVCDRPLGGPHLWNSLIVVTWLVQNGPFWLVHVWIWNNVLIPKRDLHKNDKIY